ncbi:hypothetical protein [Leptolyngbya sp. 7M]|uniref:hypothetical protein n=1 Tax=Leptolyngbya sp. 7M TaxID=2812896 RepID=UPI001B8D48E4|nr:hypothetical protein [Leptolyngbya sp. 7M]QYO63673.1 hypothetical protein JVX88_27985 [Leptolyngbya sp. 7M]
MRKPIALLGCLVLTAVSLSAYALNKAESDQPMLVSAAREGFTPAQAEDLAAKFNDPSGVVLEGGDVALFGLLNHPEVSKTAVIARSGPVMELEVAENPEIGQVRFQTDLGDKTLE